MPRFSLDKPAKFARFLSAFVADLCIGFQLQHRSADLLDPIVDRKFDSAELHRLTSLDLRKSFSSLVLFGFGSRASTK
jgi:hypothetical protein